MARLALTYTNQFLWMKTELFIHVVHHGIAQHSSAHYSIVHCTTAQNSMMIVSYDASLYELFSLKDI